MKPRIARREPHVGAPRAEPQALDRLDPDIQAAARDLGFDGLVDVGTAPGAARNRNAVLRPGR